MTQGATPSLHERPEALTGPPQQSEPPPGRAPHPTPPHVPQVVGQQISCVIRPRVHIGSEPKDVGAGVGAGEMIHGLLVVSQDTPEFKILPPQHIVEEPGNKLPHPVCPHCPHSVGQQRFIPRALDPTIPRAHVGSGCGVGVGGAVSIVKIQGAEVSSQETPEFRIGVPQQEDEPPGKDPHELPPQTPQESAQQIFAPNELLPMIPRSHIGSAGGGGGT